MAEGVVSDDMFYCTENMHRTASTSAQTIPYVKVAPERASWQMKEQFYNTTIISISSSSKTLQFLGHVTLELYHCFCLL